VPTLRGRPPRLDALARFCCSGASVFRVRRRKAAYVADCISTVGLPRLAKLMKSTVKAWE